MTITEITNEQKKTCGFRNGLGRVGSTFKRPLIIKLMEAFNVTSTPSFYNRVNGEKPLTPLEVEFIEQVFSELGIPIENIWDCYNKS